MSENRRKFMELKDLLQKRVVTNIYTDDEEGILVCFGPRTDDIHPSRGFIARISAPGESVLAVRVCGPDQGAAFAIIDPSKPEKIVKDFEVWAKEEYG